jgi:hypothetical protein
VHAVCPGVETVPSGQDLHQLVGVELLLLPEPILVQIKKVKKILKMKAKKIYVPVCVHHATSSITKLVVLNVLFGQIKHPLERNSYPAGHMHCSLPLGTVGGLHTHTL